MKDLTTFQKVLLLLAILAIGLSSSSARAQNALAQQRQLEVNIGMVRPVLQGGSELMRSERLRDQELSYFADADGNRRAVGNYSAPVGISFGIAYYTPVKWAKGLMLGAAVRNTQTGTEPAQGGYEEGYFFNFLTAGFAAKLYPLENRNVFVKADVGLGAVFTKNRFLNEDNEQRFLHQFGIGSGGSLGVGYAFTPFKNKSTAIELQVTFQQLSTRVEVDGIGDDQWQFGALHLGGSVSF